MLFLLTNLWSDVKNAKNYLISDYFRYSFCHGWWRRSADYFCLSQRPEQCAIGYHAVEQPARRILLRDAGVKRDTPAKP